MKGPADETVGTDFSLDLLQRARDLTLAVIEEAAACIRPGMTEAQAKHLIQNLQAERGAPKSWHPPQIRFGKNTLLPFGKKGEEDVPLAVDDVFFFDLGPIFEGHEGDVGRTYSVGSDSEMRLCGHDVERIWKDVQDHWKRSGATGPELYAFAEACARKLGWVLTLESANGHRIADFPHAARARGSIERFQKTPAPARWILEIQIRHPSRPFGAFFEDLLI